MKLGTYWKPRIKRRNIKERVVSDRWNRSSSWHAQPHCQISADCTCHEPLKKTWWHRQQREPGRHPDLWQALSGETLKFIKTHLYSQCRCLFKCFVLNVCVKIEQSDCLDPRLVNQCINVLESLQCGFNKILINSSSIMQGVNKPHMQQP